MSNINTNKQSLKEKVQLVIEESLEAEVIFKEEVIIVHRQVNSEFADEGNFVKEYLGLLEDLHELYSKDKKIVVVLFSVEQAGETSSTARSVTDQMRNTTTEFPVILHSYTCDTLTGLRSKLTRSILDGLSEETVSGLDVDIRVQANK